MERGKSTGQKVFYSENEEPIVLSKHLLDILLKEKNYTNLLALYTFYYYTAKWQKTNQPRASIQYVSNGIGWGADKIISVKGQLKELGLVEDIVNKEIGTNKIIGHYIKVNFIWSQNHIREIAIVGEIPNMAKQDINALSSNNINSHSKKPSVKERNKQYYPIAEFLASIVLTKKNMKYSTSQIQMWCNSIRLLSEENQVIIPRIKASLKWYRNHIGEQYCPVIESGKSLKEKFFKLEAAMERENKVYTKKYDCPCFWKFGVDFSNDKEGCMRCQDKDKTTHIYLACEAAFKASKKK